MVFGDSMSKPADTLSAAEMSDFEWAGPLIAVRFAGQRVAHLYVKSVEYTPSLCGRQTRQRTIRFDLFTAGMGVCRECLRRYRKPATEADTTRHLP